MAQRAVHRQIATPLCRAFTAPSELSCVTGISSDSGDSQALLFYTGSHVSLGEATPTRIREPRHLVPSDPDVQSKVYHACWDAYSGNVYGIMGEAVVRLSEEGDATVVAGHPTANGRGDGAGLRARLYSSNHITSDDEGCLYVTDDGRLRRLQLPAAWRVAQPGAAGGAEAAPRGASERQQGQGEQRGTGSGPAAE